MLSAPKQNRYQTIELAEGVKICTTFDRDCIPALRSGFALYPVNPRWNVFKFRAWKRGRQLRQALDRGEAIVSTPTLALLSEETANQDAPTPVEPTDETFRWGSESLVGV